MQRIKDIMDRVANGDFNNRAIPTNPDYDLMYLKNEIDIQKKILKAKNKEIEHLKKTIDTNDSQISRLLKSNKNKTALRKNGNQVLKK